MVEKIINQAGIKPNVTAIMDDKRALTYKELKHEILSKVEWIASIIGETNEAVGLLFPNSVDAVTWMLALAKTDHPAILFGSKMKENEINHHIDKIGLRFTLANKKLASKWTSFHPYTTPLSQCKNSVIIKLQKKPSDTFEKGDFICHFSSGSEGEPKAVIRTLKAVESEIMDTYQTINIEEEQTFLTIPPICHSYGLIAGTLLPLYYGHKLILEEDFLPMKIMALIRDHKVNVLFAVPYMYHLINKCLMINEIGLPSIKMCFSAGAPMDESVSQTFWKFTGIRIVQDYGSTETGVMCLNMEMDKYPKSVGKPVVNHTIGIINEEGDDIHAMGSKTGEICILSEANVRRYLYPEALNQQKFINGYFRTGDVGRIGKEGEVYVVGRLNSLINVAGNKVDPVEVENVIKLIPEVKEAAVVCVNDINIGDIIKAYVVAEGVLDEIMIKRFCKNRLADYKIPKMFSFICELPRSQTGKILKKYLVKEY